MKTTLYLNAVVTVVMIATTSVNGYLKGREPKLDYLCDSGRKYTVLPWDCKGYLQCSADRNAYWMQCPPHQYWNQRARTCTLNSLECDSPRDAADEHCPSHPHITFPNPESCAKYYDCGETNPHYGLKKYVNECPLGKLYDDISESCQPSHLVNCGKRQRPYSKDGYVLENGPCKGRPNGPISIPGQEFSNYFLYCVGGKASPPRKCYMPNEVFDTITGKCTTDYRVNIINYCVNNAMARFPVADNCAKYYDCRTQVHSSKLELFQTECDYKMLYDAPTGICRPYSEVTCGDRFEPKSPCEYTIGHCAVDGSCMSCSADCKYLEDGIHDYTATADPSDYLECKDGRTTAVKNCPDGFTVSFHNCVDRAGKTVFNNPVQTSGANPVTDIANSELQSTWFKGDQETGLGDKEGVVVGRGNVVPSGGMNSETTAQDQSQSLQWSTEQNQSQSSQGAAWQDTSQSSQGSAGQDSSQSSQTSTGQDPSQSSQTSTGQDPSQSSQTSTGQDPSQSSQTSTSQDPSQSSQTSTGQDPSQSSQTSTGQDPSQSSQSSTGQDPSQSSQSSTGQDPSQSSQSSTGQDPSQSSQSSTDQDPSQSSQSSTGQDPSQSSQSSTGQNPSQSSQSSTGQDPSQSSQSSTGQDPSQSSQSSTGQNPSQSSQSSTGQDPSQSSQSSTGQDPSQSSQSSTGQDPSQSSQGTTSQDPPQSQSSTGQDPSQSSQSSTGQDPSQSSQSSTQSSQSSTGQDPSQSSQSSTDQDPSQSSQSSTDQDPSQSSQSSTDQDPSQSSQSSTGHDPSQSSQSLTGQDPSQSSQGTTSQDPPQSSQSSTSQDPSQSSQSSTGQDPSQSSQSSTGQDPSQSSQSSTGQDPSQSSQSSTSQDPSQSSQSSTGQDPSQSSQSPTDQDPSQSSQSPTDQDPSQSSQSSTDQDPSQSSQSSTGQDPSQSSQSSTGQDPSQSSQSSTSQDPSQSSQSSTGQDPSQSSQSSTGQDPSQSSQSSTDQDPSQSSQSPTGQDPSQSSQSSTGQDPSQSSQSSTGQDTSQSSQSSTGQEPSQSSQSSTGQDPSQSAQSSTGQDPSQSSQSSTGQDASVLDPSSQVCQAAPKCQPVVEYHCNCTDQVNVAMDKIKILSDFVAEQKQLNALASLECKNPPTLARAKTTLHHNVNGAEASYTCEPGYSFCGSRPVSSCPGNGVWSTVDGMCVQSVWNYPRVTFRQKFLCSFTAGTVITIYGTPTRYKKAIIQLESGMDRPLVLTMCFQCGSTKEQVTFGIEEEGVPRDEVIWGHFPFKVGKEFKVVISVTQSAYKIEVDSAPPYYFSHILPVPHVESVAIIDEITVRKLIIEPSNNLQTFMPDAASELVPDQSIDVRDDTSFTFKVKACENAQFQLASQDSQTSQAYIVDLGARGNNMSSIRKCDTCKDGAVTWHQPLSCLEFKAFWVSWSNGQIRVGSGYIPDKNEFLNLADSEYPINYFRISQHDVNPTEWILSTPIQKCGLPPPIKDSDVFIQEVGLEAEAVYTCQGIYSFCGESHVSRCTEEGTWEGYKGECLQSTWHMLRMPASIRFPCSFGLGSVLSIHGSPMSFNGFKVSLNSGADTLMQMATHFSNRTVIYQSTINKEDGIAEEDSRFSFMPGKEFHLTITVETDRFSVAVDGTHIHGFNHRGPYYTLNTAEIKGQVFVRKVQVFPSETASSVCQQPSPILNGNVATQDTTVGTEVQYTCNADHLFCGSSSLIVCDNHGNWNGLDGTCEKGTWYNLGTPTVSGLVWQFPCRYQPGFQISMKGKLLRDETVNPFFSFEIQDNTETMLIMTFYKTEIKMNSRLPDLGTEETVTIPALAAESPIHVRVMIIDSEFMIFLDTSLLYQFKHRAPAARASSVVFFPNIDITELKFTVDT